jgi:hypothetical protein
MLRSFDLGNGNRSIYCRYCNETLYPDMSYSPQPDGSKRFHPWSSPFSAVPDRQVALVHYLNVTQGVYVCANGGNCTAPNVCSCAPGWAGFDCRCLFPNFNLPSPVFHAVICCSPSFRPTGRPFVTKAGTITRESKPTPPLAPFLGFCTKAPTDVPVDPSPFGKIRLPHLGNSLGASCSSCVVVPSFTSVFFLQVCAGPPQLLLALHGR